MTTHVSTLAQMHAQAEAGGGSQRAQQQHEQGKLTARERIDALVDAGSFVELDKFKRARSPADAAASGAPLGDGVVTGYGDIEGRQIFLYAQDVTVADGSVGAVHAEKICKVIDLATQVGAPIVGLIDSAGPRLSEGPQALAGGATVWARHALASGVVPQIACVMGASPAGALYAAGAADFLVKVQGGKAGGAGEVSNAAAHFVLADDSAGLDVVRHVLSFLPGNNAEDPPRREMRDDPERRTADLAGIIPASETQAYNIKDVIRAVVDEGLFLEVQEAVAPNMVVALARMAGRPVGVVANQPLRLGGCLDSLAATKAARFVRFCDCFNIPLMVLVDTPGAALEGEASGGGTWFRDGAKLLYAFAEATVPKVTLVVRRAFGAGYGLMASKPLRADMNFAFPGAQLGLLGVEDGFKGQTAAAVAGEAAVGVTSALRAAELGLIDEVITPDIVRPRLVRALDMLRDKRQSNPPRKHGNIPL